VKKSMKGGNGWTHVTGDGIRDGDDRAVSVPALSVGLQPTSAVRHGAFRVLSVVVALEARESGGGTYDGGQSAVSQKNGGVVKDVALTFVVRLPRFDDRARNGLAARSEHATLNVHVLSLPFRRDRLSKRNCGPS
jgi:hypothetical protein